MQIGLSVSFWIMVIALAEVGLVGQRDAHVDVEHVGASHDLGGDVALDGRQVTGAQLLLEDAATRGVDPLPDQAEAVTATDDDLLGRGPQLGLEVDAVGAHGPVLSAG